MADTAVDPSFGGLTLTGAAPLVVQSYGTSLPIPLATSLRNLFPGQRVPVLNADGTYTNEWYRAHRLISDLLIGSVPQADLIAAVNNSRNNVARLEALAAAIEVQARQNAASQQAMVSVIQTAALPGAVAIPPVQTTIDSTGGDGGGGGGGE